MALDRGEGSWKAQLPFDWDEAVSAISGSDKRMAGLINTVKPFELSLKPVRSPFRTLVEAIAAQQLTWKAASTILGRFRQLYDGKRFPSPEDVLGTPDEELRGVGFSWAKVASIKDLAGKSLDGTVPTMARLRKMEDEGIMERLTRVRGIGPWTVEMLLIFGFGRPDVLPATDYGIRKGFTTLYERDELAAPDEILRFGERWRPYRSVASLYLWQAVDTQVFNED
jgi:DNA-3-methyladenine glycosylase II